MLRPWQEEQTLFISLRRSNQGLTVLTLLDGLGINLDRDRSARRFQEIRPPISWVTGRVLGGGHVAAGTGGCGTVVFTGDPLVGIQVHLILVSAVVDAMDGLLIDLLLGVIRPQVAAAAVLRLAGLGHIKIMSQMAGRAWSLWNRPG